METDVDSAYGTHHIWNDIGYGAAAMRIVDKARLGFQEGKSDKVFEVDLVEVATKQYVVNFRFGRRGSALRDGTKTALPVSLEQAQSLFARLVAEKTQQGYKPLTEPDQNQSRTVTNPLEKDGANPARTEQALIGALARGRRDNVQLHLVLRKVGERGLREAEPYLLELLAASLRKSGTAEAPFRHLVISALARCGTARALAQLRALYENRKAPRHISEVALLALTILGGSEERRRARAAVPKAIVANTTTELSARVSEAEVLLAEDPEQAHSAIFALYASAPSESIVSPCGEATTADQLARRVVLAVARIAKVNNEELGLLRALNWAAEIRRDGELFALLARRFETRHAGSVDALNYFRRRAARTLLRLGRIGSPDYVAMASELLLCYHDDDAEEVRRSGASVWDHFGRYHALNLVLYGNSSRFERAGHRRATWRCRGGYSPGDVVPHEREEAFPELWDQNPSALFRIGISDAATVVIAFAVRALRAQTAYQATLDDSALAAALARAQRPMQVFALDLARARTPNVVLARGALASELDEAAEWVLGWVKRMPSVLEQNAELLAALITTNKKWVHDAVVSLALKPVNSGAFAREFVLSTVAVLMTLDATEANNERAQCASDYLLERAPEALLDLSADAIRDLLSHHLSSVARLGAEIVLRRSYQGPLESGLLNVLLDSNHPAVLHIAARILANTPPSGFKNDPDLLVHFALCDRPELREGTRGLIAEVAKLYPDVGQNVAVQLLDALLTPASEGAPAHVVSLLRHELRECLPKRSAAQVLSLTCALSPHAREAGGLLLGKLGADDFELEKIVHLANHEILSIRQGAWALASGAKDRFRITPVALARLCDARWEDSRQFAFEFVRSFPAEQLMPDTVIAICDSTEPPVQRFGQTLLFEHWRDEHAERILLRLSEHPSTNIQRLVTGLLDRHARGNTTRIAGLLPCLTAVLTRVNRGGVAKLQVLDFLRKEALVSIETATLLAPLLERQSLTAAVSHRAPIIATMLAVRERYPEIPLPIVTRPEAVENRSRRGV